eukprot:1195306-Prorocentrum_minimum.AAC.4
MASYVHRRSHTCLNTSTNAENTTGRPAGGRRTGLRCTPRAPVRGGCAGPGRMLWAPVRGGCEGLRWTLRARAAGRGGR